MIFKYQSCVYEGSLQGVTPIWDLNMGVMGITEVNRSY